MRKQAEFVKHKMVPLVQSYMNIGKLGKYIQNKIG